MTLKISFDVLHANITIKFLEFSRLMHYLLNGVVYYNNFGTKENYFLDLHVQDEIFFRNAWCGNRSDNEGTTPPPV